MFDIENKEKQDFFFRDRKDDKFESTCNVKEIEWT